MHHGSAVGKSEEVVLDQSFMADVLGKKVGRQLQHNMKLHFNVEAGMGIGPTHELRIVSFKTFWFLAAEPFLKRLRVLRDARIITFFIAEKPLPYSNVRFSITCLPHIHLNSFDVHNKYTGFEGGCQTTKAKQVLKTVIRLKQHAHDLKAIVWNVSKSVLPTLAKSLYCLVTREQPTLIILLGENVEGNLAKIAASLGYSTTSTNRGTDGWIKDATILWNDEVIHLQKLPTYNNMMHIRVTVRIFPIHPNVLLNFYICVFNSELRVCESVFALWGRRSICPNFVLASTVKALQRPACYHATSEDEL